MTWLALSLAALARLVYLTARVNHTGTDECHYREQAEVMARRGILSTPRRIGELFREGKIPQWLAPPTRVLYLYAAALAVRLTTRYRWTMLSALSSLGGVACVGCAAVIGHHLGGDAGGAGSALLVGTSPLCLGLGRRVLADVPAAATQLGVLAGATLGAPRWPVVSAAIVVMLLTRESARTFAPGLLVAVAWLWGWDWARAAYAFGAAAPAYCLALRLLVGAWPWQFPSAFGTRVVRGVRKDPAQYATNRCAGGLHRLLDDVWKVSPAVVCVAIAQPNWLGLSVLVMLVAYSMPWLDQQIRTCLVADLLLRVSVAMVLPWWAVAGLAAVDVYVFWRVWLRAKLYDPTSYDLAKALGLWR